MNPEEYRSMAELEGKQWWYAGMRRIASVLLTPLLQGDARNSLRLLDAGCGTGFNLQELARFGETHGIDLSPLAVIAARLRGGRVTRGNVLTLPYASASFDVVTSFDVLYHAWVGDDGRAVQELARVLKPGGLIMIKVPALRILWGAHDEAVHSRHRYTRGELEALVTGAGLTLIRSTYANSLLFPVLLGRRWLDRLLNRHGSDVALLPPLLERTFGGLLSIEASLIRSFNLPIGASVFAVARKPTRIELPPGSKDMTPEEFERERAKSAEALDLVVETGRDASRERTPESVLGALVAVSPAPAGSVSREAESTEWNPPAPPDLRPVNESWRTDSPPASGVLALLRDRSREQDQKAQVRFNSHQVQLDNALLTWTAEHFAATHKHFDGTITKMQKRMDDIDTRHRELERELVRHVHEMARRIDVVLGEGEKGRVSHEAALRSVRERLRTLEEKLR